MCIKINAGRGAYYNIACKRCYKEYDIFNLKRGRKKMAQEKLLSFLANMLKADRDELFQHVLNTATRK